MPDFKNPQLDLGKSGTPLILALPSLFEPRKLQENGAVREDSIPRYSATFMMRNDHPDLGAVYAAIVSVAQQHFPQVVQKDGQGNAVLPHRSLFSNPLANGDEYAAAEPGKKYRQPMRGYWLLRAGAPSLTRAGAERKPPALSIVENGRIVDLLFDETRKDYRKYFFGGANVFASIGFGPRAGGSAGVTAYLNLVVSLGTGDPIPDLGSSEEYTVSGASRFGSSIQAHVGTVVPEGSPYATTGQAPASAGFAPPPGAGGFSGVRF